MTKFKIGERVRFKSSTSSFLNGNVGVVVEVETFIPEAIGYKVKCYDPRSKKSLVWYVSEKELVKA